MPGPLVLEFGASWCPICRAARPLIDRELSARPDVQHLWVEDGKGKPLGRSFRVTLWPTLVFWRDGRELGRIVRPSGAEELAKAFEVLRAEPGT
jgi:thioredoxin 1